MAKSVNIFGGHCVYGGCTRNRSGEHLSTSLLVREGKHWNWTNANKQFLTTNTQIELAYFRQRYLLCTRVPNSHLCAGNKGGRKGLHVFQYKRHSLGWWFSCSHSPWEPCQRRPIDMVRATFLIRVKSQLEKLVHCNMKSKHGQSTVKN